MSGLVDTEVLRETMGNMALSRPTATLSEVIRMSGGNESLQHSFIVNVGTTYVYLRVNKHGTSTFLWCGTEEGSMANLCVSIPTRYDSKGALPSVTQITGNSDSNVDALACKLSKKLQKPIFVSYNLNKSDLSLCDFVTKKIFEEILAFPDKF